MLLNRSILKIIDSWLKLHLKIVTYLPEYAVYCISQKAISAFRWHQLRSQDSHKFIKINLAIPWNERKRSMFSLKYHLVSLSNMLLWIYCTSWTHKWTMASHTTTSWCLQAQIHWYPNEWPLLWHTQTWRQDPNRDDEQQIIPQPWRVCRQVTSQKTHSWQEDSSH